MKGMKGIHTNAKLEIVRALADVDARGRGRELVYGRDDNDDDDDDYGIDAIIASMRSSSVAYALAKRKVEESPSSAAAVDDANGDVKPKPIGKSGADSKTRARVTTTTPSGTGGNDYKAGQITATTRFVESARPEKGWESVFVGRATGDRVVTSSSSSLLSAALRDMEEEEEARSEASKEEISIDIFLFGPGGCAVMKEHGMSDVKTSFSIRVEAKSTIRELVDLAITESSSLSSTSPSVSNEDGLRSPPSFRAKEVRFMDGDMPDFDLPPVQPASLVADIGEREFAIIVVVAARNTNQSTLMSSSSSSSLRVASKGSSADSMRSAFERVFLRVSIPSYLIAGNQRGDGVDGRDDADPLGIGDETQSISIIAVGRSETLYECLERLCVQRGIDVGSDSRLIFRRPAAQGGSLLDMGGTVDAALRGNFEIELRKEARRVSISRFARQSITIFMTMDEFTASQYVEYNVVKVNRHGTREQRVVGIDRDKMYNMRQQHALGVTVASMIMGAGMGRRDDARALIRHGGKKILSSVRMKKSAPGLDDTKKKWRYIKDIESIGFHGESKSALEIVFRGKAPGEMHSYIYEFESRTDCTNVLSRISFLCDLHSSRRGGGDGVKGIVQST